VTEAERPGHEGAPTKVVGVPCDDCGFCFFITSMSPEFSFHCMLLPFLSPFSVPDLLQISQEPALVSIHRTFHLPETHANPSFPNWINCFTGADVSLEKHTSSFLN
jgi:hypothetical protein